MGDDRAERAWRKCVHPDDGVLARGVAHCAKELKDLVKAHRTEEFSDWVVEQVGNTFLEDAQTHFSRTYDLSTENAEIEAGIFGAHTALRRALDVLTPIENALELRPRTLRNWLGLVVGKRLQYMHPPRLAVQALLQERYLLFDVQTPRGGSTLKHTRVDALCAAMSDLAGGRCIAEALGHVVFGRVDELIAEGDSALNEAVVPSTIRKVEHAILPWLYTVGFACGRGASIARAIPFDITEDMKQKQVDRWRLHLMLHLHEGIASVRTHQIMRIVRDWPDSLPAVEDIKACLAESDCRPEFVKALRKDFEEGLLNAGADTALIVQQYVKLIRLLRFLDPTGFILDKVSGPICAYLRNRSDTIRCIVNGMTVDGDLYAELEREPGLIDDDLISVDGDPNPDIEAYAAWEPDPIDAPSRETGWRPGGDAIATLVNIYGSSDLLVAEYRTMLADRLLSSVDIDIAKEKHVVKLLCDRFGEEDMQDCIIMLRDMDLSAEIAGHVKHERFETSVISKEFWPKASGGSEFAAPKEFRPHMRALEETFEEVKKPRKLRWQHGQGVVSVECSFADGRVLDIILTPLQAAICLAFGGKSVWNVAALQEELEAKDRTMVVKALVALAGKGVLRAVGNDRFETVERAADVQEQNETTDDGTGADAGADEEEEANMKVFEKYILAMLQNLKESPLEKVHNMLKLFVKTPVYDKTQDQLAAFLQRLVSEDKIEVQAGLFKIKTTK